MANEQRHARHQRHQVDPASIADRIATVRKHLGTADHQRLDSLVQLFGGKDPVLMGTVRETLFPEAKRDTATTYWNRLVAAVDEAAELQRSDIAIETVGGNRLGDRRPVHFTVAVKPTPAGSESDELDAVGARRLDLSARVGTKPAVRVFLSWASKDRQQAEDLWDRLTTRLKSDDTWEFDLWSFDKALLTGEDWHQEILTALERAHIGMLAVSPAFLASSYIRNVEVPELARKRLFPIQLGVVDLSTVDLGHIAGLQAYRGPDQGDPKPYTRTRGSSKDVWVEGLVHQLRSVLDKYGETGHADASGTRNEPLSVPAADDPAGANYKDLEKTGDRLISLRTGPGGIGPAADRTNAVNAVEHLIEWATDPDADHALAAVLGETGTGKTITCQEFEQQLRSREDAPVVHRFDLRALANLSQTRTVPPLLDLMDEVIANDWKGAPLPSAASLIETAKQDATIFIFDGLDEALVHLTPAQGIRFTESILRLQPHRADKRIEPGLAGVHTKLLVSCRTHYFKSLKDQTNHFTENQRGNTRSDDYLALTLLPLTEEQIRWYVEMSLPGVAIEPVMETIEAVHDLSDLTQRPYTLSLVVDQLPDIHELRRQNQPVYSTTIYRQMVAQWLARDDGKHTIDPEHKFMLMARFAAWLWERGGRLVEIGDLNTWLHGAIQEAGLGDRYRNAGPALLEEDFRTATFLVRVDTDERSSFRFAHTSIQEYLLAEHLISAVRDDDRAIWAIAEPSRETFGFVGQLLAEDAESEALLQAMRTWRRPYLRNASETLLRYCVYAQAHGWPQPGLATIDLSGADLRGLRLTGSPGYPVVLANSTWHNTDLRFADLSHIDLRGADFSDARLDHATLHACDGADVSFARTSLTGALAHHCSLPVPVEEHPSFRVVPEGTPTPVDHHRRRISTLTAHTSSVRSAAFSPDGATLITTSHDNTARVWDTTTWETTHTMTHLPGGFASWSRDQKLIAVSGNAWRWVRVALYDRDGRCLGSHPYELIPEVLPERVAAESGL